jgi:hypothetical protein
MVPGALSGQAVRLAPEPYYDRQCTRQPSASRKERGIILCPSRSHAKADNAKASAVTLVTMSSQDGLRAREKRRQGIHRRLLAQADPAYLNRL